MNRKTVARLRVVPITLELKMCACGRLKAKRNWRMINSPVFDFIQRVINSNVGRVTIMKETCTNCQ